MATTVEQSAISVSDLMVGFGKKIVLDHLSLEVRRGEILGLVGASGGGKSVLLRTIIGLIPKRQGQIEIMGMELDKADPREIRMIGRRWGILFQQGALFSSLTVRQNVQFPMRENLEISDSLLEELATAKLEMVGLTAEDGNKFPSELSGGMTKRAALARALALDPEIVFLDEPTRGLDPVVGREIRRLIVDMSKQGVTIFLTTHYMEEADQLCDRVAFLSEGRIVALDTPDNLKAAHGQQEVNVTLTNGECVRLALDGEDAGRELQQLLSNGHVKTLHSAEATLEEVFIELAGRRLSE